MEFKQLEIFIKLVENLSFSTTASELNISQPTVSLTLKQLEEELDTPLFLRSTRELKLTAAGQKLYDEAKKILADRDKLIEKFIYPERKVITIGASTIPAGYLLPSIIKEFKKKHPDIYIKIEEKNSLETIKKVSANTVDIGIVGMQVEDENCEFLPIYKDEFVFISANNSYYQKLKKSNPSFKRIAQEPFIMRETGSAVKQNMELILKSQKIDLNSINISASINDTEVLKQLTAEGLGTSFISKIAVADMVKHKELIAFELDDIPHQYRDIYLVWNKKINYASHIKDFLNCMECFKIKKESEEKTI
ncbi:selenium metabolism-associated LysR family transcriptional regulator [Treponema putidum]|uniref:LysR family transcriptional regulator n=1 Tax=Treponema putidum TaxID=221027 RepID=A0AAE9MVC1_9SPIR|nr:selenium metabolism-associated LysR family transcriptional regulator [Treponema putidum]AIN93362.1 LysR family transcriptional regulator [Treponema putidum]TWI74429.1 DNA-binding transcriptional LysR family regulator [Treponema putidum]UTY29605.1 LysR family transcriptional regulator [Treponema putidum]UTY32076.1 LysR family transcriptional regulator [Treponema putidum]UTY34462.1 LysR family transcriptional regulator [Treponema putidum]